MQGGLEPAPLPLARLAPRVLSVRSLDIFLQPPRRQGVVLGAIAHDGADHRPVSDDHLEREEPSAAESTWHALLICLRYLE